MARTSTLPIIPAECTRMGKNELIAYGRSGKEQAIIAGLEMYRRRANKVEKAKLPADDSIVAAGKKGPASRLKAAASLFTRADDRLTKQVANTVPARRSRTKATA